MDMSAPLNGYCIAESLYASSRTSVYRGMRENDRAPVTIKVLRHPFPSFNELLRFRNQYAIACHLEHPAIVRPLALERWGNCYALVMPDCGAIVLSDYWQQHRRDRNEFLSEFLAITLQLTDALHYLGQQRIIHKDIKPANILIHPETHQIQLIDFSIASLLPKEQQYLANPNVLEGTLAYISPEQTGRMNRCIDYRTDFYSLGVTLFELLTGELPFTSADPMELLHCHMAQAAKFPINNEQQCIPDALQAVVLKLMAKNAEDRYQSALGLRHDLERCRQVWDTTGKIPPFNLGENDRSDRFIIPEKLYGRETEVQLLLAAFDRVAAGNTELMLVAGFSGIGKTAVVNEVHKPIVRQRGYFIKGKFDQFNRNIPFSAFVQAFRDLMGQLLSESDEELANWKAKILAAVGDNGQVLIDVIPELELAIGPQPPVPELSGTAVQNRFNLLFQKFIAVFATPEHPLVMFLDDLQWADSASLNLMKVLMEESEQGYLLLLGAYRDNEVFPAHPLMLSLGELEKQEAAMSTMTLAPLTILHVNQLIAETLSCPSELAQPLTELVYQKTKGNPFFTTQFLQGLYEDELIVFNGDWGYWECDLVQVQDAALTDNVVEFMAGRLQKLPQVTQNVFKLAACIGSQFDLETLAIVCESPVENVAADLWSALREGLVLPITQAYKFFQTRPVRELEWKPPSEGLPLRFSSEATGEQEEQYSKDISVGYRFLHDRVQQAAYSLIPEDRKQQTHLTIGRLLLEHASAENVNPGHFKNSRFSQGQNSRDQNGRGLEDKIFDIVNHLNMGVALIVKDEEKKQLCKLNLQAGCKAKNATAYEAAIEYLGLGIELLTENSWECDYELTLALYESATEAAYLNGDFEKMEQLAEVGLNNARALLDTIKLYQVKIQALEARARFQEALDIAAIVLEKLGIRQFPKEPDFSDIERWLSEVKANLGDRHPMTLAELPAMTDPNMLAAMTILFYLTPTAYKYKPALMVLITFAEINLSLRYGNSPLSAYGYSVQGLVLCNTFGEIEQGYQFGKLSLQLELQSNAVAYGRAFYVVTTHVKHYKEHLRNSVKSLKEAYAICLEVGDLEYAGYALAFSSFYGYLSGQELSALAKEMSVNSKALERINKETSKNWIDMYRQIVENLLGRSQNPCAIVGEAYDEEKMLPLRKQANDLTTQGYFYVPRVFLCYLFQDWNGAAESLENAENCLGGAAGTPLVTLFYFYHSLVMLAEFTSQPESECQERLEKIATNQKRLKTAAIHAPTNYLHKWHLVEAETYRVLGKKTEAMEQYDCAIAGARENEYIQEEAVANERAAQFYLDWNKEKFAALYMQAAYYCYAQWGAKAKTDDLEERYPQLLKPILQPSAMSGDVLNALTTIASPKMSSYSSIGNSSSSSLNQTFDFASILKASQALSGTIQLDDLLRQLSEIILQSSGGDRCALILPNGKGEWRVEAIATAENIDLCGVSLESYANLPVKLIQYVKNTREVLALDDFETDLPIVDPYLDRHPQKSLLCLPLLHQGQWVGILYVSNQSTQGVFARDRILILNFLCTQAATSLENARLYQTLEQRVEERTEALRQSQQELSDYVENAATLLHCLDANGIIIWANQTELEFLGYDREDYIGQPIARFHADEDAIADILARLANHETLHNYEARLRCKDGAIRYVQINSNVFCRDGKFVHIRCFTTDITARKLMEQELQASERRYATLAEMLPTGIFLTDPQGHSRYNNPSCCRLLGLTPAEALGEGWAKTLHPDDRERVFQGWYQAAHNHQMPYVTDCRFQHRDGTVVWLAVQAVEEIDPQGHLIGYVGSLTDITERKAAETALNDLVEGTAATIGEDFFPALVHHISRALRVPIALVTQFVGEELQSLAFVVDGELQPNFTDDLPETPCRDLVVDYAYHCPSGVSERFPNNPHRARDVESYLGVALRDRQGQVLGSLCIFDRRPLQDPERVQQILNIFSGRAAAELERQRAEQAMERLNQELEVRVRDRTAQLAASEDRLKTLFNQAADAVFLLGEQGFIDCNQAAIDLLRYASKNELLALQPHQISPEQQSDGQRSAVKTQAMIQEALQRGSSRFEWVHQRCDGETFWAEITLTPIEYQAEIIFHCMVRDISDRKQLEQEQARLIAVLEATPDFIGIASAQGEILWHNKCLRELRTDLGDPDDHRLISDCHPDWVNQIIVNEVLPAAIQQGSWSGELALLDGNGDEIPVSQVIIAHKSATGEVENFSTIMRDMRDRKAAENALQEEQLRLKLALDAAKMGTWSCTLQTGKLTWSDRAQEIFGFEPGTFPGDRDTFTAMIHPDDCDRVMEAIATTFETGAPYQIEYRIRRLDGEIRWLAVWGRVLSHPSELELQLVGVVIDVSDRKQAEAERLKVEQVRKELTLLEHILDVVLAGYWDWDIPNHQEYLSPGFKRMFGYEDGELPNTPESWENLIFPEDLPTVLDCFERHVQSRGKIPYYNEVRYRHKNGSTVWVLCSGQTIEWDEMGNPLRMIGCHIDITERKQAEVALQQAKEKAEVANQAKSAFLSNMSHELRTPLNGILGYAQILQQDGDLELKHLKGLQTIYQCGTHLLDLIEDILDLSKIEAEKMELYPAEIHFPSFLNGIVEMCRIRAEHKGIDFIYQIPQPLPRLIYADEKRLRQVLINLLGNAIKFTAVGTVTFSIEILVRREDHGPDLFPATLRFQVQDTGTGIAATQLKKIFLVFEQVGENAHKQAGTGLGLAISQKLVQMMGAEIQVISQTGQGSQFWFDLCLPVSWQADEQPVQAIPRTIVGYEGRMRTILLVEDRLENRDIVFQVLTPLGFEVLAAEDGCQGLELAQAEQPDLILSDLRMPVMDGFEMIRQLRNREQFRTLPIIALSASAYERDRAQSKDCGATDFLAKPLNMTQLMATLQTQLHLEWKYQEERTETAIPKRGILTSDIMLPERDTLEDLYTLARSGFLLEIKDELVRLESKHEQFGPFCQHIAVWLDQFEGKKIQEFLQQSLDSL